MIEIESRGSFIAIDEVTYQYQDEPSPGGLLFTILVSGTKRDSIYHLCKHILQGGDDQIPALLASLVDRYASWGGKKYVLNTICTIDIGDDQILLEAIGSSLCPNGYQKP